MIDPERDFVRVDMSLKEYAEELQKIMRRVPVHLREAAVPLAHIAVVERTLTDPFQRMKATILRRSLEEKLGL